MAAKLTPDVVLMDINMPGHGRDLGDRTAAAEVPTAAVVMMSVQGEADYLRRSMLAGAREFLVKPFSSDELTASIRQVYTARAGEAVPDRRHRSPRRQPPSRPPRARTASPARSSRSSARRAASAHDDRGQPRGRRGPELGQRTCLVDGSFQFGDVGVLLNLNPQEQVDRGPHPRARGRASSSRSTPSSSATRRASGPAGAAVARDGRAHHAGRRQAGLEALRARHDLVVVDCPVDLQRHDARDPRRGGHRS